MCCRDTVFQDALSSHPCVGICCDCSNSSTYRPNLSSVEPLISRRSLSPNPSGTLRCQDWVGGSNCFTWAQHSPQLSSRPIPHPPPHCPTPEFLNAYKTLGRPQTRCSMDIHSLCHVGTSQQLSTVHPNAIICSWTPPGVRHKVDTQDRLSGTSHQSCLLHSSGRILCVVPPSTGTPRSGPSIHRSRF